MADHVPGQLSLGGRAGELEDRATLLRAELDALDTAKNAARSEALQEVAERAKDHRVAGDVLDRTVAEARAYGATWQQIADAVGLVRSAAWQRWAHR